MLVMLPVKTGLNVPDSSCRCMHRSCLRRYGFTLVEVLVVVAVIAVLIALLMPALRRARIQAQVMRVQSDLHQIAIGLTVYQQERRTYPAAAENCLAGGAVGEAYNRLPPELNRRYMGSLREDVFNKGHSYKYTRPGFGWQNGIPNTVISLYVPRRFPYDRRDSDPSDDQLYPEITKYKQIDGAGRVSYDVKTAIRKTPVEYAVWSVGPSGDVWPTSVECATARLPVPRRTWFSWSHQPGKFKNWDGRPLNDSQGVIPLIAAKKEGYIQWTP